MDLFSKKLTINEAMHYNAILDDGGLDTDLLMVFNGLNTPTWTPNMPDPTLTLTKDYQKAQEIAKEQNPSVQIAKIKENNYPVRQYIKLPNAIITKHIHKYRGNKTKGHNE